MSMTPGVWFKFTLYSVASCVWCTIPGHCGESGMPGYGLWGVWALCEPPMINPPNLVKKAKNVHKTAYVSSYFECPPGPFKFSIVQCGESGMPGYGRWGVWALWAPDDRFAVMRDSDSHCSLYCACTVPVLCLYCIVQSKNLMTSLRARRCCCLQNLDPSTEHKYAHKQ